jgi:light-regulated signal transduction histidine kinase (bacteriophytochrome)
MILRKEQERFDQDTVNRFNEIRKNAKAMGQLIDDLLAFSRLGRQAPHMAKLDMDGLSRDVWGELRLAEPSRRLTLEIGELPQGMGDRNLIRQVWINLLSNAIKFTRLRDTALIEVGGYPEGEECVYFVRDNGAGFDMAYYDKLFGIFQRLHSADEYEGTGVGLAITQRIILRHGGRIWAEGEVDKGTKFSFTLPAAKG